MLDLDERLKRGPLRVRSSWSAEQTRSLGREELMLRRRRFVHRAAFTAASAAAIVIAAVAFRSSVSTAPRVAVTTSAASTASVSANAVTYADGSIAQLGAAGGVVHLDQQSAELVSSTVVSGSARFDVVPNPARTFEVHAGDVTVRVLGTAFVVERSGNGAHVAVERGRVRVSWPGGEAELGVGEGGEFPPSATAQEPSTPPVPVESLPLVTHVWRDFARRGQYAQAFAALRQTPNDVEDTPQDLLLAADVARLSGHPAQAVAPLRKVSARYPKDPRAPVAAFTLGRVLLDDLGRASDAAAAFGLAEKLWPGGPLAGDATARQVEALKRAGQKPQARAVAEKYLAAHPSGRHAASLRAMLAAE